MESTELISFLRNYNKIRDRWSQPFDPRFNAFHWIADCRVLVNEIEHSYKEMVYWAEDYKKKYQPGEHPSDANPKVNYYAGNTIIRLFAFREKVGLALYSYYADINPYKENTPGLYEVINRLGVLVRTAGPGSEKALAILQAAFDGTPSELKRYRDYKVHRREPRIELFGVKPHHDFPYLVSVFSEKDKALFEKEMISTFPDPHVRAARIKGSTINGVIYRNLKSEENKRLFNYTSVSNDIKQYRCICYSAASEATSFLNRRKPFVNRGVV